jgi:predicted aconitase
MYATSFQDGSEVMDIKVEEVTDVKEEKQEEEGKDPLAITCPTSDTEQEVSCVSVCPAVRQIAYVPIFVTFSVSLLTKWLHAVECNFISSSTSILVSGLT